MRKLRRGEINLSVTKGGTDLPYNPTKSDSTVHDFEPF